MELEVDKRCPNVSQDTAVKVLQGLKGNGFFSFFLRLLDPTYQALMVLWP